MRAEAQSEVAKYILDEIVRKLTMLEKRTASETELTKRPSRDASGESATGPSRFRQSSRARSTQGVTQAQGLSLRAVAPTYQYSISAPIHINIMPTRSQRLTSCRHDGPKHRPSRHLHSKHKQFIRIQVKQCQL